MVCNASSDDGRSVVEGRDPRDIRPRRSAANLRRKDPIGMVMPTPEGTTLRAGVSPRQRMARVSLYRYDTIVFHAHPNPTEGDAKPTEPNQLG